MSNTSRFIFAKMKNNSKITEISLDDVPQMSTKANYYDGEIFFADNISSIPQVLDKFKLRFIAFVFCTHGEVTLHLDSREYTLHARHAIIIDSASVVSVVKPSPGCMCKVCAFNPELGFNFMTKGIFETMMQLHRNPLVKFTNDEITLMLRYYELAKFKMDNPSLNYGKGTMAQILKVYVYDMVSCITKHLGQDNNEMMRQGDKLYRRFIMLLSENANVKRSVNSFATELCVSPKYLTSVCRAHSGKTAGELVAMSVVGRVKQLLLFSDKSIKEIAAEMQFSNLSFFGKYVKKHLGHSPNNYRRINGYGR